MSKQITDFERELTVLLENVLLKNERMCSELRDIISIRSYSDRNGVWTEALQRALNEHEVVIIPKSSAPYIIDNTVVIPSNRRIIADDGARILLAEGTPFLMMRNSNTEDGTHKKITAPRNENITIEGGIWEEWCPHRMGYRRSGKYDDSSEFLGVSTCMLFENISFLTLKNMTFRNCGGFALQLGELSNVIIEKIRFESCFADGIHVNGNVKNIWISDVSGEVGDDLVAFNMFDWQNSSVNFGPCQNVICEDLELSESSHYKALRIEPGMYTFDNGETVDCSLTNAVFRRISGIKTFKLYCQTPVYYPNNGPEPTGVGGGDNIIFEDIKIDLDAPIDLLKEYVESDKIKGTFAGFELGLNANNIYFRNIDIKLYKEKYPLSYLVCIGPKSVRFENGGEVFDPYLSSTVKNIYFENITVNGEHPDDIKKYVKEIEFDALYDDIPSTGRGKIENITYKK